VDDWIVSVVILLCFVRDIRVNTLELLPLGQSVVGFVVLSICCLSIIFVIFAEICETLEKEFSQ
jgi:hypothetical protein